MRSILTSVNLPATTSMSAQVAAMHNYSSTAPSSKSTLHSYTQRQSMSAPHTPQHGNSYVSHKHRRQYASGQASPQIFDRKQARRLMGIKHERDLHSVSRKLTSGSGRRMKHHQYSYSRNASDNEDPSELGKRKYHNSLERQRRNDIKHLFDGLRAAVPALRETQRAAKMTILQSAADHIRQLIEQERRIRVEERRLLITREQLKRRMQYLEDIHY